jgi:hypothetical protein
MKTGGSKSLRSRGIPITNGGELRSCPILMPEYPADEKICPLLPVLQELPSTEMGGCTLQVKINSARRLAQSA